MNKRWLGADMDLPKSLYPWVYDIRAFQGCGDILAVTSIDTDAMYTFSGSVMKNLGDDPQKWVFDRWRH
jgi:hypothetical protein